MRIGVFFPTVEQGSIDDLVGRVQAVADRGFAAAWLPQSSGHDALTALAVIGRAVGGIELGTAVVPTFPRHPLALAAQALTANDAIGGRLRLGIGLSHQMSVEGRYGLSYDQPARHMDEYLSVLLPALRVGSVAFDGETLHGHGGLEHKGDVVAPPVLLAALQPRMLRMAGGRADGTITWCTGVRTLEEQIVPIISGAATEAGRPAPRVVVALPTIVTDDEASGRVKAGEQLRGYGDIPAYRRVLDREGVAGPADVSVVGDAAAVTAHLERIASVGGTDFVAIPCGTPDDRRRTLDHLATLA